MGLLPRRPLMLQPTMLSQIMPAVTDFKHLWFNEDRAFQSCMTWFVGTLEFCMKGMMKNTTPEIIGGKYLRSYLKLLRKLPCLCSLMLLEVSVCSTRQMLAILPHGAPFLTKMMKKAFSI